MGLDPDTRAQLFPTGQRIVIWMPTKHMGNLLVSLKSIEILIQAMPRCHWYLVVDRAYRDIVAAAGLPITLLPYDGHGTTGWKMLSQQGLAGFIGRVRRLRPFVSIALEGDKVSRRLIPLCGSKLTLGPTNRFGRHFSIPVPIDEDHGHRFEHYAAVAAFVTGIRPSPAYPLLNASPAAQTWVGRLLDLKLPRPDQPFAILHAGATKSYKQWPLAHFADLANDLHRQGVNVVLTGAGSSDGEAIRRLTSLCSSPVLSLHDQLDLDTLIALCRRSLFFVGNDTGPTHLAAASGTPTYALFGPTDDTRWGPVGASATVLRSNQPCEPLCSRSFCLANYRCMTTLTPSQVRASISGYPRPSRPQPAGDNSTLPAPYKTPVILHVFKRYNGNYPLLNAMVSTTPGKYRNLVCYLSGKDDGKNRLEEYGARAIYLGLPEKQVRWQNRDCLRRLRQLIDSEHVDILVCQFRRTVPIGAIAARLSRYRPKVIALLHGIVGGKIGPGLKLTNALATPFVSAWIGVSQSTADTIYQNNICIPKAKVFPIYNGVELGRFATPADRINLHDFFPNPTGKEKVFVSVGRLADVKNHIKLINAFKLLVADKPCAFLLIVGAGPLKQTIESHINQLKIGSHVALAGQREDIPSILQSADVFVMPSLREGFGLALIEAMASGKPVITSNQSGMIEIVEHTECGWLVDPTDERSIFHALKQAESLSIKQLEQLGANGKARALATFNVEKMTRNYEALYSNLLNHPFSEKPLVSIITPAYNCTKYIRESLQSACLQSYDRLEILVVDDGSTDNTCAIVEELAQRDQRIQLLRHHKNLGISAARNTGITASRGEYIAFLDADDLWDKDKILRQLETLTIQRNSALAFTASRLIDDQGNTLIGNIARGKKIPAGKVTPRQFIIERYPMVTSSVMVRREALEQVGQFNTRYSTLEDFDLWLRIVTHYPQAYVPEVLTSYRRHDHNTVSNELRNRENKIHYIESLLSDRNPLTTGLEKPLSYYLHRQYLRLAKLQSARGNRQQALDAYETALLWPVSLPRYLKTRLLKSHYLPEK